MTRTPIVHRRRRARLAAAALLALSAGAALAVPATAAPGGVRVVSVLPGPGGADAVVAELTPAPVAPLRADAVSVTAGDRPLTATVTPALDPGTPVTLVVDASADGAAALPQSLSGMTGLMFKLASGARVGVVADRTPPQLLTPSPAAPSAAIQALTSIRPAGARSTDAALDLAARSLGASPTRRGVLLLTTGGPAPADAAGLAERLRSAGIVLAVAATGQNEAAWSDLAGRTGGLAVAAPPTDSAEAYDEVLDALRSRYMVTVPAPSAPTRAQLVVQSGGDRLETGVDLPAAAGAAPVSGAAAAPAPAPAASEGSSSWPWFVLEGLVVAAAVGGAVLLWRRGVLGGRRPAPAGGGDSLEGVRVFDVSDPARLTELDPRTLRDPEDAEHDAAEPENAEPENAEPERRPERADDEDLRRMDEAV